MDFQIDPSFESRKDVFWVKFALSDELARKWIYGESIDDMAVKIRIEHQIKGAIASALKMREAEKNNPDKK